MVLFVHDPPNTYTIDGVWVFISVDADGKEGLCAMRTAEWGMLPMMTSDRSKLAALRAQAMQFGTLTNKRIKLVLFNVREDVEWIK